MGHRLKSDRLDIDEVMLRVQRTYAVLKRGGGDPLPLPSAQVRALMEVLVDMINETEPERPDPDFGGYHRDINSEMPQ